MADKAISQLNAATSVTSVDLFVLEQSGEAKKLTGQILENWLVSFADGHGGIQSITKTGSTGTNPVIDTYTILLADETTTTFQVVNGIKGDTGDQTYVWIRYAHTYPTADSDMGTSPDEWIGIYSGTSTTAPTHYTDYTWYQFKGETGDTGAAATITAATVGYQQSDSGSVVPEGSWTTTVPTPVAGKFLWTRIQIQFNTGSPITAYSVARYGIDGTGAVSSVNSVSPDATGNVQLLAADIQTLDSQSIQAHLDDAEDDIAELKTSLSTVKSDLGIVEDTNTATHTIAAGQYVIWKDALYTASQAIPSGTTLSSSNLTAVSGGGLNDIFQNLSNSLLLSGDWRNAPVGLSAYNYEGADTTTYDLPSGYATVLVIKATSANGGIAYATDWRNSAGKPTWVNNRHGDAWEGWLRIDSSSIFSVEYTDTIGLSANASQSFAVSKQRVGAVPVMAFMTLGSYGDWCNLNQSVTYGSDAVSVTGYVKSWNSGSINVELKTTVLWRQIV